MQREEKYQVPQRNINLSHSPPKEGTNARGGHGLHRKPKGGQEDSMQDPSKDIVGLRGQLAPVIPEESLTPEPTGGTEKPLDGVQIHPRRPTGIHETKGKYGRGGG